MERCRDRSLSLLLIIAIYEYGQLRKQGDQIETRRTRLSNPNFSEHMQDLGRVWGARVVQHVTNAGVSERIKKLMSVELSKRMPSMRIELISEDVRSWAEVRL
jgi:hypothetical protein